MTIDLWIVAVLCLLTLYLGVWLGLRIAKREHSYALRKQIAEQRYPGMANEVKTNDRTS